MDHLMAIEDYKYYVIKNVIFMVNLTCDVTLFSFMGTNFMSGLLKVAYIV